MTEPVLALIGLNKAFGALTVTDERQPLGPAAASCTR